MIETSIQYLLGFGMPGGWEMVVIALVVLLLFGAKKIPELARGLGRGIREFKDATQDVKKEINDASAEVKESPSSQPRDN